MKRILKTREVLEFYNGIEEFIKKDINLPIQFAWDLEDNSEILKNITEKFERHRSKILFPLQEKGAYSVLNDGQIKVEKSYVEEFKKIMNEIEEYLDTDNEVDIKMVKRSDIPTTISVKDLRAFKFMISDED